MHSDLPGRPSGRRRVAALLLLAAGRVLGATPAGNADVVVEGNIYTGAAAQAAVEAMALKDGRIVFTGTKAAARAWIGPRTRLEDYGAQRLLPGLVDAHIHPLVIVDLDVCDLASRRVTLAQLSEFAAACVKKYAPPAGGLLNVHQWDFSGGNQPDPKHPTLRAALDAASTQVRIQVLGNDGHHGAFNSLALAQAKNAQGQVVGLSRATLAKEFLAYRPFVGVDESGEPNGAVNEDARYLLNEHNLLLADIEAVAQAPERISERLNSAGITAVQDAMAPPDALYVYDKLAASGKLTARLVLAQFYDPSHTRTPGGAIDYDGILAQAQKIRARYATHPLIRADVVKLFADGVLEGNPFAVPPTLPNAASLKPFLQPIFAINPAGQPSVTGYVDTASALCGEVRAQPAKYSATADVSAFIKAHGYHPGQCAISSGELQHERGVIMEYVRRMHRAGFALHIHAISDRSVRTALDAIEAARSSDGNATTRDSLAHLQLVHPDDVQRIGKDHLYTAFTYSWAQTEPGYDMTVIPFFEKVSGNSYQALHRPGSYYEANAYPAKAVKAAGGILTAGSDAPVNTRDPQPFVNMAIAITRALPNLPPLNPQQAISVREAIEAYTLNGARMLGIDKEAGSLEVGKSADFIVLDRDILALGEGGHAADIMGTKVLETWFQGKRVYRRGK
jgi:predicted amidohydrolase YtcJ